MARISGPLLDRIDIHIELAAVKYKDLVEDNDAERSETIKARVKSARERQRRRFKEESILYNSQMDTKLIKKYCGLDVEARKLLKTAITELGLSARAYNKILKVSRTIADLAGDIHTFPDVRYIFKSRQSGGNNIE